jgi:crotonobetainyl-CoA:carnitine CoA-transferase CaiB-like acyl-CoA transferase
VQIHKLFQLLGKPEDLLKYIDDPVYRQSHMQEFGKTIEKHFKNYELQSLIKLLNENGIPAAAINTLEEAFELE